MRKFGWKRDSVDSRDFLYALHAESIESEAGLSLPSKVDLSGLMSPVEDQGAIGSCVAHATCGVLEYIQILQLKQNFAGPENFGEKFEDLSRLFLYYNARYLDGTTEEDAGTHVRSAVLAMRHMGICREYLWAYDPSIVFIPPSDKAYAEALAHKVIRAYRLDNTKLKEMKRSLAHGHPFMFGISIYDSFMSPETAKTGMVSLPKEAEECLGGHALCCVGYDDSLGCFLVRNSWGPNWGIQGYCYIPYAYLTSVSLCADVWTLRNEQSLTQKGIPMNVELKALLQVAFDAIEVGQDILEKDYFSIISDMMRVMGDVPAAIQNFSSLEAEIAALPGSAAQADLIAFLEDKFKASPFAGEKAQKVLKAAIDLVQKMVAFIQSGIDFKIVLFAQ